MANAVAFDYYPDLAGTIELPANRGVFTNSGLILFQRQSLPDDPIGTINATFSGVPASSEIRVYRADGIELAGVESSTANPSLSWSVYAAGANSVNRIVIINLAYKIKEFEFTPTVGSVSIPIQMDDDDWYSNPA